MVCLHITVHVPSSYGLVVIALKPKTKYRIHAAAMMMMMMMMMMMFYIIEKLT
jgi:hypothetical protein